MTVREEEPDGLAVDRVPPVRGLVPPARASHDAAVAARGERPRWLPAFRHLRHPRWWEELAFVLVSYGLYTLVRNSVPSHTVAAFHRAHAILRLETDLHLDVEHGLNQWVASSSLVAYLCSYWYLSMHFIMTIGVLVWLYRRHPLRYRPIRSVLYVTNILALFGFWFFALAPPRMLPGFTDTVDRYPTFWGSWNSSDVAAISNQVAAMPSLHIGWSLWCGLVIFRLAQRPVTRVLGLAYPTITLFVILGTANHFLLDAIAGVLILGVSFLIQRAVVGRGVFELPGESPAG